MTLERLSRARSTDDESGVTLIFVAIFMVAMLVFAALVIDGGNGVATRRKMQNAADAGAMAGTLALRKAQAQGSATGNGDVATIVANIIGENDANAPTNSTPLCQVVTSDVAVIGECSDSLAVLHSQAAGVLVYVESDKPTFFGGVAGQPRQTVRTKAAATLQVVNSGTAPWIVCGSGTSAQGPGYDLLNPDYTFNNTRAMDLYGWDPNTNTATGSATPNYMVIQENNNPHTDCGAGAAMNGSGDGDAPVVQGDQELVFEAQPGNPDNIVLPENWAAYQVAGGTSCAFDETPQVHEIPDDGCDILLPISKLNEYNGSHVIAHIVAFAAFRIFEGPGNQKVIAYYRGPSMTTTGFTTAEQCTIDSPLCAVKLRV